MRRRPLGFRLAGRHIRHNVVGYIALFVALGGTALAGGYVVSDNSQLGPGTVSGSEPPGGKHDNIIDGSISFKDIAPDSIGGGRINESTLGTVPNADQVDGLDGGELAESPGFGLGKFAFGGKQFFKVNDKVIQRRVATSCPPATAVRTITQSGAVDCVRGPMAFAAHDDFTGIICNKGCNEGTLSLPAGFYAISAKIVVGSNPNSFGHVFVHCSLNAGSDKDEATWFADNVDSGATTSLPFALVHNFTSPGTVALRCDDDDIGEANGLKLKITAIRLGGMTDVQSDSGPGG
jgi:hypothetical protein